MLMLKHGRFAASRNPLVRLALSSSLLSRGMAISVGDAFPKVHRRLLSTRSHARMARRLDRRRRASLRRVRRA